MKKVKIKIDFSRYTDSKLIVKGRQIVLMMTNNAYFTTPNPTLASITTAISNFETALGNAADGSKADTEFKNQQRAVLEGLLKSLGAYVELTSNNDKAKAKSSGFDVYKEPEKKQLPITAVIKKISNGNFAGSVVLECVKQVDADTFQCRYSLDNGVTWVMLLASKKRKQIIPNLPHGKDVLVEACAINNIGNSDWSAAMKKLVD